jgi:hypothetical protein
MLHSMSYSDSCSEIDSLRQQLTTAHDMIQQHQLYDTNLSMTLKNLLLAIQQGLTSFQQVEKEGRRME